MAGEMYCQHCGTVAAPVTRVKGSFATEVLLWLLLVLPGLLYTLWRLTTKAAVCPACQAPNMIPVTSPKARAAGASSAAIFTPPAPAMIDDEAYAAHAKRGQRFVVGVVVVLVVGLCTVGLLL